MTSPETSSASEAVEAESPSRGLPHPPVQVGIVAVLVYLGIHVGLAVLDRTELVAVFRLQSIGGLAFCAFAALGSSRPEVLAAAAGYVSTSEVGWRANNVGLPWEGSKLLLCTLLVVGIIRYGRRRPPLVPLIYLALLAPGTVVALESAGLGEGVHQLTFGVLAHVAIGLGVIFFRGQWATTETVALTLWVALGPILLLLSTATFASTQLDARDFSGTVSNAAATGGFGPNQVSAVIALGALFCGLLVLLERRRPLQLLAALLALACVAQSAVTFSRGGLFSVAVALIAVGPILLGDSRTALRAVGATAAAIGISAAFLFPALQEITGGALSERFTSSSTTLRTEIAAADLDIWLENPVLGVGVGEAAGARALEDRTATHTEFTAMLAEHGLLGLSALLLLFWMAADAFRRQPSLEGRVVAAALVVWSLASMTHIATRLAVIPFAFALAACAVVSVDQHRTEDDGLPKADRGPLPFRPS